MNVGGILEVRSVYVKYLRALRDRDLRREALFEGQLHFVPGFETGIEHVCFAVIKVVI